MSKSDRSRRTIISKDDVPMTPEEKRLVVLINVVSCVIFFVPMAIGLIEWNCLITGTKNWAWRTGGALIPSNALYVILPPGTNSALHGFLGLAMLLDSAVVGLILACFLGQWLPYTYVPALRSVDLRRSKRTRTKEELRDIKHGTIALVIIICITVASNIAAFITTRYAGGTYICVTPDGISAANTHSAARHSYTWDDVMLVEWYKHWTASRHRSGYYIYHCVEVRDGTRICLGAYRDPAIYIAHKSNIIFSHANRFCPACDKSQRHPANHPP